MALSISRLNEVGFPGIVELTNDPEGGDAAPVSRIKAIYEYGDPFSVDFKFEDRVILEGSPDVITPAIIEIVSTNLPVSGISVVKIASDTLRISGTPSQVFTDSYYEFIMKDKSIKILPPNTTEEFLSIITWSPPLTKFIDTTYVLNLNVALSTTPTIQTLEVLNLSQGVYWYYPTAVQAFRTLLSKGTI